MTGFVSSLFLANHSDSESFLVMQPRSDKMDAGEKDSGRWLDMWCQFLTCPGLSWFVVAY